MHKKRVLMVVNSQVYIYLKSFNRWVPSVGYVSLTSRLSNTPCYYTEADSQCKELCLGHQAPSLQQPHLSQARGYVFACVETSTGEQGVLLRVCSFISFTVTGLLIDRSAEDGAGKAAAAYFRCNGTKSSPMSIHSSTTFQLLPTGPDKLWRIQNLALRGFIILWTTETLLISTNNGLIVEEVTIMPSETFQSTTFPDNVFLLVTTSGSQIAVLTRDTRQQQLGH